MSGRSGIHIYALLLMAAFSFRVAVARFLPNDSPFDGQVYAQIARNVLEQHVYSHATEPPFDPSLIRLPGYPLFLAGVYSIFGHGNNTAVRIVQALIDIVTCALISLVAFFWEPEPKLKQRSSIAAFTLAVLCPFTTIYVATILTETLTSFFAVATCLIATLAFTTRKQTRALGWWAVSGLLAGVAVLIRPDSGLFAAAIGITLVVTTLAARRANQDEYRRKIPQGILKAAFMGAIFSLAFCFVLVPWTVRNFRVFHLFQPLAPAHAEMPGEFVPRGYLNWLRTWIDDSRYVAPVLWKLEDSPINIGDFPERAFDSAEEKKSVAGLLEKYNHPPPGADQIFVGPNPDDETSKGESAGEEDESDEAEGQDETQGDESDQSDLGGKVNEATQDNGSEPPGETVDQPVEMTPEIDAGFAALARERIARRPLRYYLLLPIRRAGSLWFDTHSQYFPFEGELLPLEDLDTDLGQQFWLPLFAFLTFIYTILGIAGGWRLWKSRDFVARRWLLLAGLIIFLRLGFFATLENPEPRYVVELFPFLSILGGIAISRIFARRKVALTAPKDFS